MSASGILFVVFTAMAFASLFAGKAVLSVLLFVAAAVFMCAAIYHDDEKERRIAELEMERGKDDVNRN